MDTFKSQKKFDIDNPTHIKSIASIKPIKCSFDGPSSKTSRDTLFKQYLPVLNRDNKTDGSALQPRKTS